MLDIHATYTYNFPTTIRFGIGVVKELGPYLKEHNLSRPLLVTDELVFGLPFFKNIIADLEREGISPAVFYDMHKNPLKSDVLKGGDAYHGHECDAVIGIGGGVAMDVARAIVLRVNHTRDLFDYDDLIGGDKYVTEEVPHFITVPTTSGTGSEVGRSAIISDDETRQKKILFSPKLLAKIVFADPMLTLDLPPFVTAATGMDALTHNMEAYLSRGFNPMCDGIAISGMRLIGTSIVQATKEPNMFSRSKMMIGSLMGAVAFQKGLGIVHSLAHPLSSLLDTHHGLANAICLPHGLKFNYQGFEDKYNFMAYSMNLGTNQGKNLVDHIEILNQQLGLPDSLSQIGVKEEHIKPLAALAVKDFCLPSNPKIVTEEEFEQIYRNAL
ncbi:iron-containing alcohol dehydrogenase [Flammeovirga kamogawensis]|uniref:Iron-containing alcohol dehydrogenase n=1 Tax=Flammeovirga kamogawensis TaxID=373891 RepID=A0ABX8GY37_9BACT|nr:iron-containing alcohol dehydrogenase [Flammeovirga kamogawensis]MBB6458958.1 alcohol dehydrogenase class IV [Flammeovirga kamogawensis]QWG08533.1 iron-containing alcohol dehydrogenase [Flammeovirga kamogawensis]TRX66825.1 iron-containing alcohol dehydrogenase [Flammeovirga kamogawensis]